ncbi:peptide methionine sulfoxide reductase [Helicobacter mustelae 12198]|uniref:Peptide methionine sulfoxide reductase MsrA n=1 Tax=Helicobacter mustelae (strain ATCC 43772 / CCUG 25715 / CIP 103759 / LMG 18044 / NCTC 12198 / R85-136P) TaxID=679897 RepID=D3UHT0_HELM1|nr:peptide methionine sulfoxide reductase [Helicobacter mustelae 12198]SQH71567.1 peptide methionine sulfoxide reductase [Helicobacter mustelae]
MREVIYLAGGCFWGLEAYMKRISGIKEVLVGYANGNREHTSYEELHESDHAETIRIVFESEELSLERLLGYYFRVIDPTSINKQGGDHGRQYRTGIYYIDSNHYPRIFSALEQLQKQHQKKIQIELEPLRNFVVAEEYHQDYLGKNPGGYCHIDITKASELLD